MYNDDFNNQCLDIRSEYQLMPLICVDGERQVDEAVQPSSFAYFVFVLTKRQLQKSLV